MKKMIKKKKLGRKASHRKSLRINMMRSLINYSKVETTTVKAKVLKSDMQKLINSIKEFDVKTIRNLKEVLGSDQLVSKFKSMFESGIESVTIRKIGFRDGDNAEMSRVTIIKKVKEEKENK